MKKAEWNSIVPLRYCFRLLGVVRVLRVFKVLKDPNDPKDLKDLILQIPYFTSSRIRTARGSSTSSGEMVTFLPVITSRRTVPVGRISVIRSAIRF